MLDVKDFTFFDKQSSFDFKGFLIKTISYWKWFVIGLIIAFSIAHQVNVRKQKIYGIETTIAVKEENNPFFTSNTSLVFNWGGTSDKVQMISTTLKSRSHNELVVDRLNFYIDYLKQTKYFLQDVYGEVPFKVTIDKSKNQLLDQFVKVKMITKDKYQVTIPFQGNQAEVIRYAGNIKSVVNVPNGEFKRVYRIGQEVNLPFLNWKLTLSEASWKNFEEEILVRFNSFDNTVSAFKGLRVDLDEKAGSILKLGMEGTNKARMVDYLNATVDVLIKKQLENKNQFAENTINFIDETLIKMEGQLKDSGDELKDFSKTNNIIDIEEGGTTYKSQLLDYDAQKDQVERKLAYLSSLKNYLKSSVDFSKLPAPTVAGIEEPNITTNVAKLIALSIQRSDLGYSIKGDIYYERIDNEIQSVKKVLLENANSLRNALQYDLELANEKIRKVEGEISRLPENKQEWLKLSRKYNLSDNIYNTFLQKRSEASIVKAANLSDIQFIDPAKDVGGGLLGPKTSVNYVLAFFVGLLVPLVLVFFIFFISNSIQNIEDISTLTQLPLIGIVGIKHSETNLSVFERPKSALSESFRAIRSSLQFLYKKQSIEGTKTLMLTSSVSGEGKTFCSINIATVFALSEKKTIILGLDLRKPKIFDDFNIQNDIGAVNYLIGQRKLEEVIQHTHIPYLDVITSGPIPPNPSELILGDSMKEMMMELKKNYDYIILDTPPVGLVSDALELAQFCDVTLYIVRQNFTKKEMLTLLNNRTKRGELNNVSIIFNGYENKAKYGVGYGYGYGYGYSYGYGYGSGYHEDDEPTGFFAKWKYRILKKFRL
ncbi:polysaccharide biosynthesis tyrosine autokinase [Flavobacterium sp. J49]|uniref:polysaccharide biosynthesis tyrosine autokinase n=1 Tax=Flavobacterium sp. J49 TaxID=2718534 RepID=UPI00159418D0|nr:tyrosine-protein kinase [Flavobacterium sp. J49]MBF6640268.1 polysaccharide biosynthesis tyrosine autokinase [Flavobacterium sp. J49]NIC01513.1 polysaccharide biosynthesis tyrosine autokinase [Flavobacterium sp. J49]